MSGGPSAPLCSWVLGLKSQIFSISLNSSASYNLFGTGRSWADRWPDPQLSIWSIKLSKKASSLQILVLVLLPTVWPVGVSDQCQNWGRGGGGGGQPRIHQITGRERGAYRAIQLGWALGMHLFRMMKRWRKRTVLTGPKSLPWALLEGGRTQNKCLKLLVQAFG